MTQTTFPERTARHPARGGPRSPHNWFIAIAHNACRLRFRHNARRPNEVALDPELAASTAADAPTATEVTEVLDALADLPLNQRSALAMRELEGRSYAEIARRPSAPTPSLWRRPRSPRPSRCASRPCHRACAGLTPAPPGA